MPLRMILDSGAVDPPEKELIASIGLRTEPHELDAALEGTQGVYVALDADALDPEGVRSFMPEPDGLSLEETERHLRVIAGRAAVLGAGLSGLAAESSNVEPAIRLIQALGL